MPTQRLSITFPPEARFAPAPGSMALSRDGRTLIYLGYTDEGGIQDIAPDGEERFLAVMPREVVPRSRLVVVENWTQELLERVPIN